jgi:hypothetical protein
MHGVFHTEVFKSVWRVVDAVNQCKQLKIKFPEDHDEQSRIAAEFEKKSRAGFKNCVGAIDGILISTEKPNMKDCEMTSCGPKKFFCGRKKKFGLNMQATCDARARFLDVSICHPGSTSDYLAFATSPLKHKLERPGFLAPGLVLFGDNAYVNTNYMVTPFKAVSSGPKDDYNFYHSQVRIKVECSFGILVHRWGILRRPMSSTIGLRKTTALVMCLCSLHNFCIDQNGRNDTEAAPLAGDLAESAVRGGIPLVERQHNHYSPDQLLNGGHHYEDFSRNLRRRLERHAEKAADDGMLPRERLLHIVESKQLKRPTPAAWRKTSSSGYR